MDWEEIAKTWDERQGTDTYAAAAYDSLERSCEDLDFSLSGSRACDFGCGTGLLSERLAEKCAEVVAIDSSKNMIAALEGKISSNSLDRIRPLCTTLGAETVATNPLLSEPFDIVVCSSVCAFLDDYPGAVTLLGGLLRKGGLFVQWDWELTPDTEMPAGLTRGVIRDALLGAGLEVVSIDTGFAFINRTTTMSPLMAVGRM